MGFGKEALCLVPCEIVNVFFSFENSRLRFSARRKWQLGTLGSALMQRNLQNRLSSTDQVNRSCEDRTELAKSLNNRL